MYLLFLLFGDIRVAPPRCERAPPWNDEEEGEEEEEEEALKAAICFTSTVFLLFEVKMRTTKSTPFETSTSVIFCRCVCDASGHVTIISNVFVVPPLVSPAIKTGFTKYPLLFVNTGSGGLFVCPSLRSCRSKSKFSTRTSHFSNASFELLSNTNPRAETNMTSCAVSIDARQCARIISPSLSSSEGHLRSFTSIVMSKVCVLT
mmetsp:Transcript_5678/g.19113  ORF Transcript_5678/g.19113 Transcript_5678/m.19113 type:complete len:204 (-) Transcript_5678:1298-1909(-)